MCRWRNVLTASDAKMEFGIVQAGQTHTCIHLITSSQPRHTGPPHDRPWYMLDAGPGMQASGVGCYLSQGSEKPRQPVEPVSRS